MRKVLGILVFAAGCGGADNEAACNDWLEAISCGEYDFTTSIDCSIYAEEAYADCDLVEYFDCLTAETVCDEETGVPDMSGWGNCASYATCE